jgi:Cu+-exporting ATPase
LPGEQIPVDAKVVEGQSYIDESMLTGEPVPVAKNVNDAISAGTINTTGSLLIRADKVGSDTALSRIIELIKQAQNSKPDIARLADKISSVFVPTVIVISLFTALAWYLFGPEPKLAYMLITAITVLIIACPCALGLATPMSVMVGVGKAAENGVLTRNAQALQTASKINTLILDKTGTVTEGKPKVSQVVTLFGNEEDLLQAAASIEQHSEHPLATAILNCAKQRDIQPLPIENFVSKTGRGIKCTLNGAEVLLGNKALMSACNVDVSQATDQADQLANQAHTVVYVAKSGQLLGLISIADPIREDSAAAIKRLNNMGIRIIMVTGDNPQTAKAIAHQAGINEFRAEARPEDKALFVKELQESGLIVGIAGDGINDAPALAQADVGFAMGNGTDIAIESADMVLIRSSLHSVADAIELSNATLKNIKQNLFGAFIYNTLGIPVAAGILFPFTGVLLSPIIAGAAMAFSSATVVANANRLRLFKTTAPRK